MENAERYSETFATWNKVAKLYEEKFMDLDLYNPTYDYFCQLLTKEHATIFEIGCGPGNITKYLLNKRPDFKIEGTDVSPAMVALAAQNNPTATFKVLDCRNLDTLETRYDAIICGFCIPYLAKEDCTKLIIDFAKLINPQAIIYLSFVEGDESQSGYQSGSSGDRTYFYYHKLENLKHHFAQNDFQLLSTELIKFKRADYKMEEHTVLILKKH